MLLMQRSGVWEVVDAASAFGQAGYLTPTGTGDPMPYIRAAPSQFPLGLNIDIQIVIIFYWRNTSTD